MNIICIKEKLKEGVDAVSRISGGNTTLPILNNILIEAQNDKIKLTSTNLEIGIQYTVPGKVVENGSITVPAALFSQLINTLSQDRVTLQSKDGVLEVLTDSYQAKVQGASSEEFPLIPKISETKNSLTIPSENLKEALEKTVAASQFSDLRPELSAVYMQFKTDKLVFAATDSFRLAEKALNDSEFNSESETEFTSLIPLKTAQELIRLLKTKSTVKISKDENQMLFEAGESELISRVMEGNFPDYQAIIPKEFQAEVSLDKDEFMGAVKLSSVFGSSVPELSIAAAEGGKGIKVFSRDEKLGENNYVLPAKIKGDFQELSFNWKYLLDGLRAVDGKEVILGLNEENKPAMLRSPADASYFYIVMPILKG